VPTMKRLMVTYPPDARPGRSRCGANCRIPVRASSHRCSLWCRPLPSQVNEDRTTDGQRVSSAHRRLGPAIGAASSRSVRRSALPRSRSVMIGRSHCRLGPAIGSRENWAAARRHLAIGSRKGRPAPHTPVIQLLLRNGHLLCRRYCTTVVRCAVSPAQRLAVMQAILKSGPWFFRNSCTTVTPTVLQELLHNRYPHRSSGTPAQPLSAPMCSHCCRCVVLNSGCAA